MAWIGYADTICEAYQYSLVASAAVSESSPGPGECQLYRVQGAGCGQAVPGCKRLRGKAKKGLPKQGIGGSMRWAPSIGVRERSKTFVS
jgi:hypothetical protein